MLAVFTPPEAPTTSTVSPGRSPPRVIRECQAVWYTSAAAAAVRGSNPSGMAYRFCWGTTTYSAYVPRRVSPSRFQLRQRFSNPAAQCSHLPQPMFELMTTRCPTCQLFTPGPVAATTPAPSAPGMCGYSSLIPGQPCRTHRSSRFSAAYCSRTRTSPGPGSGQGKSAYCSTSGPPCAVISTAFIHYPMQSGLLFFYDYACRSKKYNRKAAPPTPLL